MDQDVALGIVGSVTQADFAALRGAGRLGELAVVYRVSRSHLGGGFGDQDRHPFSWAVLVYVDEQPMRVFSARGTGREWNGLDRLARWLRDHGFWYWWTRNDVEPLGTGDMVEPDDDHLSERHLSPPPLGL